MTDDAALKLAPLWLEAWKPPERVAPWQWAERNVSEIPYSPIPGPFRSENAPMMRDVMNAIVDPRVRCVSVVASIQSSKTLAPELTLAYIIANAPGPTLWLDMTDESAKDQSESRLMPLFEKCPPVKKLFPADKNKKRNHTVIFKNGCTLWILGANNKTNLQRRSIRWLFGDETWRWEPGHMAEAEARVSAFGWLGKCVFMSQGSFDGDDTDKKFRSSSMREWSFVCPRCGEVQPFLFEHLHWDDSATDADGAPDYAKIRASATLVCRKCGEAFPDDDAVRRRLNAAGRFVAANPNHAAGVEGFTWNALATKSWGELAEAYVRAKIAAKKGDNSDLVAFTQKRLARAWKDDFDFSKNTVARRFGYLLGEAWNDAAEIDEASNSLVPAGTAERAVARLMFLTVDVQQDHFFFVVRAWRLDGVSRLIDCGRVPAFVNLAQIQEKWSIPSDFVYVDSGFRAAEVYEHCGKLGWKTLKGSGLKSFTCRDAQTGEIVRRAVSDARLYLNSDGSQARLYVYSNLHMKDTLARVRERDGGAAWQIPLDVPDDYVKHLSAEYRTREKGEDVWKLRGNRPNHYFDCEVMQTVAAAQYGVI